jgi:3-deoxy-D-manno-octulosonate 8-phosphate phosphatase (KDO 8-P phosphatase)
MSIIRSFKKWWVGNRLSTIKILILDCDGVLTDGTLHERRFYVRDGIGIEHLQAEGVKFAIISGGNHESITNRAIQLGIEDCFLGVWDKAVVLRDLIYKYKYNIDEVAYMGDDINDLSVIGQVGLFFAPNDAVKAVKRNADYITKAKGGRGCVREVCCMIYARKKSKGMGLV